MVVVLVYAADCDNSAPAFRLHRGCVPFYQIVAACEIAAELHIDLLAAESVPRAFILNGGVKYKYVDRVCLLKKYIRRVGCGKVAYRSSCRAYIFCRKVELFRFARAVRDNLCAMLRKSLCKLLADSL